MDFGKLMEQASRMQESLGRLEDELNATVYEGSSNGLTVKINGLCLHRILIRKRPGNKNQNVIHPQIKPVKGTPVRLLIALVNLCIVIVVAAGADHIQGYAFKVLVSKGHAHGFCLILQRKIDQTYRLSGNCSCIAAEGLRHIVHFTVGRGNCFKSIQRRRRIRLSSDSLRVRRKHGKLLCSPAGC